MVYKFVVHALQVSYICTIRNRYGPELELDSESKLWRKTGFRSGLRIRTQLPISGSHCFYINLAICENFI